jgi:hypothetical protein
VDNLAAADAGEYRVVISNGGGSTNSAVATLTVGAVADPFAAWATAAGLSGPNATAEADPDGDGFCNLAEFAFGSPPTAADQRPRFVIGSIRLNGQDFPTVTYSRRPNAGTVRIVVRVSNSLGFRPDGTATGVGLSMVGDLEAVTVRSGTDERQPAAVLPAPGGTVTASKKARVTNRRRRRSSGAAGAVFGCPRPPNRGEDDRPPASTVAFPCGLSVRSSFAPGPFAGTPPSPSSNCWL